MLDHEYSEDGLSFDTLKNKDAAVAKVLGKAARRAGCELHAAVLGIEEGGYPDESPPYDWDGPIENAPQAEIGELRSRIRTLDGWAACEGGCPRFGPIDLKASELLSRRALTGAKPDERRVYPTGNEGVTMALVYRHAALVVWPGDKTLDIVAGNSVGHAVSWVATQRGRPADGADEGVRRLLARLIRIWPARSWSTRSQDRYEMLRLLHAVGDGDLGADFLQRVVTTQYDGSENVVLAEVLTLIGAGEAGAFLPKLIERHLARRPKEIVALLVLAGGSPEATTDPARRDAMREAAETALSGLESALRSESEARARRERERSAEPWRALHRYPDSPKEWIDPGAVCDLFVLADRLELAAAAAAAARAICWRGAPRRPSHPATGPSRWRFRATATSAPGCARSAGIPLSGWSASNPARTSAGTSARRSAGITSTSTTRAGGSGTPTPWSARRAGPATFGGLKSTPKICAAWSRCWRVRRTPRGAAARTGGWSGSSARWRFQEKPECRALRGRLNDSPLPGRWMWRARLRPYATEWQL